VGLKRHNQLAANGEELRRELAGLRAVRAR